MKQILFPTDFSFRSHHALHIAVLIAQKANAQLILIHILPGETDTEEEQHSRAQAASLLEQWLKNIKSYNFYKGVKSSCLLKTGEVTTEISKAVRENKIDLIILGVKDKESTKKMMGGNITGALLEITECPLLLVPESISVDRVNNIVYATDIIVPDKQILKKAMMFAEILDSSLLFLHISHDVSKEKEAERKLIKGIEKEMKKGRISFHFRTAIDIPLGISEFLDQYHADMLVIVREHEKDPEQSITHHIAYINRFLLLVFHK